MPKKAPDKADWEFDGFAFPTTTPIPDQVFDELLHRLSGSEIKVLLYICRRTFGFKRESDNISLSQMINGITTKDGRVLDRGTGLGKATVARALNSLEEKKIIVRMRRRSERRGDEPTTYALNTLTTVSHFGTRGVSKINQGVSHQRDTQQTVLQETVRQQQSPSKTDGNNNSRDEQDQTKTDVVVALSGLGISQKVAKRLEQRYNSERINEKIDFLEFIQEETPEKISNPRGWLRKAIEENYGAPDGYRPKEDRDREREDKKQREEEEQAWQEDLMRLRSEDMQKRNSERIQALTLAQEKYGTNEKEVAAWQELRERVRYTMPPTAFILLEESHLLSLKNGTAVVGVYNSFAQEQLRGRISKRLITDFSVLGQEVEILDFVLLEVQE